jgi:hypothetical protein
MDADNNIIDPMTISPVIKTKYEKQASAIKSYLARRYNNDEEWRNMVNKRRAFNQSLKYNTDPEYREKLLEKRRELKRIKRIEKYNAVENPL